MANAAEYACGTSGTTLCQYTDVVVYSYHGGSTSSTSGGTGTGSGSGGSSSGSTTTTYYTDVTVQILVPSSTAASSARTNFQASNLRTLIHAQGNYVLNQVTSTTNTYPSTGVYDASSGATASGGLAGGAIAGIVIGVLVCIGIVVGGGCYFKVSASAKMEGGSASTGQV